MYACYKIPLNLMTHKVNTSVIFKKELPRISLTKTFQGGLIFQKIVAGSLNNVKNL